MPQFRVVAGPSSGALSSTGLTAALLPDAWLLEPVADGLIALAGGGQAGATPLSGEFSRVGTVVTAGDSVLLPQAIAGLDVLVLNDSANPMNVFPFGTDVIDAAAASASVSHMQKSFVFYVCITQGQWRSIDLSTGFDPILGLQTESQQDGITAHAGGGQAAAFALTKLMNRVSIVGTAADSVVVPPANPGLIVTVMNGAAANSMNVFPSSQAQGGAAGGDAINALGQNAAFAMAAGAINIFYCFTAGQWFTK